MLIIADPGGDLKGAYSEGIEIRDSMDRYVDLIHTTSRSENVTPDFIKEKIRNFDIVHFAGHADYDRGDPNRSGWRLSRGRLKVEHIKKMAGTAAMPALIFSNACQSAGCRPMASRIPIPALPRGSGKTRPPAACRFSISG